MEGSQSKEPLFRREKRKISESGEKKERRGITFAWGPREIESKRLKKVPQKTGLKKEKMEY